MLYRRASDQARRRSQVPNLLGLERKTIGRWLHLYTQGALHALLDSSVPAGKAPALPPQLEQLRQRLTQPAGSAS